jgi:hypothetical protein
MVRRDRVEVESRGFSGWVQLRGEEVDGPRTRFWIYDRERLESRTVGAVNYVGCDR